MTPNRRKVVLAGDSLLVAGDRRHVSVMHSVPNHSPVGPETIIDVKRQRGLVASERLVASLQSTYCVPCPVEAGCEVVSFDIDLV